MEKEKDGSDEEKVIVKQPLSGETSVIQTPTTISLKGTVVVPVVPKGLEPLVEATHLFVKQCVELTEVISGYETANKYEILNAMGQRVYFALEEAKCCGCVICCLGTRRCFTFKITNYVGQPVMYLKRPCSCACCIGSRFLCDYCGNTTYLTLPDGTPLGTVSQDCACCTPKFSVKNAAGERVHKISGPRCALCCCCRCKMCGTVEFKILDAAGSENLGLINKEWSGLEKEVLTDADNYGITFANFLDPRIKAVLLGAVILIDFMYFEDHGKGKNKKQPNQHPRNQHL